jgi:hypothetical protein
LSIRSGAHFVLRIVEVIAEWAYFNNKPPRSRDVIRSFRSFQSRASKTRAEIGDIVWPRRELLELADLLARLDIRDVERFCLQRAALAHELRRLAARRTHAS